MIHTVGHNIRNVVRGNSTLLEHMMSNDLLNRYYEGALGFPVYTRYLARMVAQLSHKNPHMSILEIGEFRPMMHFENLCFSIRNNLSISHKLLRFPWLICHYRSRNWWRNQEHHKGDRRNLLILHLFRRVDWLLSHCTRSIQRPHRQDAVQGSRYRQKSYRPRLPGSFLRFGRRLARDPCYKRYGGSTPECQTPPTARRISLDAGG